MTWNKDRKQTKYGHKRREHMTHTTEDWHYIYIYIYIYKLLEKYPKLPAVGHVATVDTTGYN